MWMGVRTISGEYDLYEGYAVEFSALIDESGSLRVYEHRHASRRVVHHYPVDVWQSFSDADGEHLNPRRDE